MPRTSKNTHFWTLINKFIEYLKFFDEWIYLTHNSQILDLIIIYFNDFLIKLQECLTDKIDLLKFRTWVQYLIEIIHQIKHPAIIDSIFYFLFGYPEIVDVQSETENNTNQVNFRFLCLSIYSDKRTNLISQTKTIVLWITQLPLLRLNMILRKVV